MNVDYIKVKLQNYCLYKLYIWSRSFLSNYKIVNASDHTSDNRLNPKLLLSQSVIKRSVAAEIVRLSASGATCGVYIDGYFTSGRAYRLLRYNYLHSQSSRTPSKIAYGNHYTNALLSIDATILTHTT